jgi:EpsI family protein
MKKQFWFIAFILVVAIIYLKVFATIEAVPLPANIDNFPKQIGLFTMTGSSALSEEVLQELQVSSYINREYRNNDGYQLSLYLGYYEEQKEGSMIHSPRNCMPGSGWNPVQSSVVPISISGAGQSYKVNRILFQKGMDKILMHYWYQGRNRIVANEYFDRFFVIKDSIFLHRSEGSLVRVIGPWDTSGDFEQKQEQFVASLFPLLQQHLPQ